jgi:ubiquinone/menaquinone biosynthesis C-methylase UbiE
MKQNPIGDEAGAVQARFDKAAATWDENPARLALAKNIAAAVLQQVPVQESFTIIDYGCGTGLLTLALQPKVKHIIGMDTSPGMLAVLEKKLQALDLSNVETQSLDLTTQPPPAMQVDLIVSAMALHHIADVPQVLGVLVRMLAPGGYLALADLDSEEGNFHADKTGVYHSGFDRLELIEELKRLGLQEITAITAHTIERPSPEGVRRFSVFLISGRREA